MDKKSFEHKAMDVQDIQGEKTPDILENSYQRYLELGGKSKETDYQNIIDELNNKHALDRNDPQVIDSIRQVVDMARYAEIKLSDSEDVLDPKIVLYVKLRKNNQIVDQRLFVEVLRIIEDPDALKKLKDAYHTNRPSGTHCPLCGQTMFSENCL